MPTKQEWKLGSYHGLMIGASASMLAMLVSIYPGTGVIVAEPHKWILVIEIMVAATAVIVAITAFVKACKR